MSHADRELERLTNENAKYRKALLSIEAWDIPETGDFYDAELTHPVSFGSKYGSNGERDHIRQVARKALIL